MLANQLANQLSYSTVLVIAAGDERIPGRCVTLHERVGTTVIAIPSQKQSSDVIQVDTFGRREKEQGGPPKTFSEN